MRVDRLKKLLETLPDDYDVGPEGGALYVAKPKPDSEYLEMVGWINKEFLDDPEIVWFD
jgi:hypothetical protein